MRKRSLCRALEPTAQAAQQGFLCAHVVQVGFHKWTCGSPWDNSLKPTYGLMKIEFLDLMCFSGTMRLALAIEMRPGTLLQGQGPPECSFSLV